jgi:hypothetical protein
VWRWFPSTHLPRRGHGKQTVQRRIASNNHCTGRLAMSCTVLCVLYFAIHTAEPSPPHLFLNRSSPLTLPSPIIGRGKFTSDNLPYLYLGKTVIPRNFQDVVLTPSPQDSAPKTQLPLPARPERDRTVCSFPLLSARDWRRCGELIYVPGAPARDWHGARVEDGLSHA